MSTRSGSAPASGGGSVAGSGSGSGSGSAPRSASAASGSAGLTAIGSAVSGSAASDDDGTGMKTGYTDAGGKRHSITVPDPAQLLPPHLAPATNTSAQRNHREWRSRAKAGDAQAGFLLGASHGTGTAVREERAASRAVHTYNFVRSPRPAPRSACLLPLRL